MILTKIAQFEKEIVQLSQSALEADFYDALQSAQKISYYIIASRAFIASSLSNLRQLNKNLNDKSQAVNQET